MRRLMEEVEANPSISIRQLAGRLQISTGTVFNALREDLGLFPYKVSVRPHLNEGSSERRFQFAETLLGMLQSGEITGKIWFTDEAHFHLNGYVNKQNYRIWGTENPHEVIEATLHPQRLSVFCAIGAGGIVGPFFTQERMTSQWYLGLLRDRVLPEMYGLGWVENFWYMQDGARPHRTDEVFEFLQEHFGTRVIGLDYPNYAQGGVEWPPYSPDLNPCDFFLWGYIKDRVYRRAPADLVQLEAAVVEAIRAIEPATLGRVFSSFQNRLQRVIVTRGRHFENIVS